MSWQKKKNPRNHVATIKLDDEEQAAVSTLMKSGISKHEAVRRLLKRGSDGNEND